MVRSVRTWLPFLFVICFTGAPFKMHELIGVFGTGCLRNGHRHYYLRSKIYHPIVILSVWRSSHLLVACTRCCISNIYPRAYRWTGWLHHWHGVGLAYYHWQLLPAQKKVLIPGEDHSG